MNNKGQTLVLFVLLMPLLLLFVMVVIEMSRLYLTKSEYENVIIDTIYYGLDNLDKANVKETMNNLLDKNIKGNKQIEIKDNKIVIEVTSKIDGMYKKMFKDIYKVDMKYTGYLENNKKIIKKG